MSEKSDSPKIMDCDSTAQMKKEESSSFKIPMPEVRIDVSDPVPTDDDQDSGDNNFHTDVKSDLLSVYSFQSSSGYASSMCSSVHNSTWNIFREKKCSSSDLTDNELDYKDLASPGLALSPGPVSPFSDCGGRRSPMASGTSRNCFVFDVKPDHVRLSRDHSRPMTSRGRSLSDSNFTLSSQRKQDDGQPAAPATASRSCKRRQLRKNVDEKSSGGGGGSKSNKADSSPVSSGSQGAFCLLPVPVVAGSSSAPSTSSGSRSQGFALPQDFGLITGCHYDVPFPPPLYAGPVLSHHPTLVDHLRFRAFGGLAAAEPSTMLSRNCFLSRSQNLPPSSYMSLSSTSPLINVSKRFASVPFSLQLSGCALPVPPSAQYLMASGQQLLGGRLPSPVDTTSSHRYRCRHCCLGFKSHSRLAKHMSKSHRGSPPQAAQGAARGKVHECAVCQKSFSRSDMLTRHMRLHTGVKPYSCRTCGQMFSRSDHLSTHKRTHTGEKPYRCPVCPYAASRRDLITRHVKTHGQLAEGAGKRGAPPVRRAPPRAPPNTPVQRLPGGVDASQVHLPPPPSDAQVYLSVPGFSLTPPRRHSTDAVLRVNVESDHQRVVHSPGFNIISNLASSISEINVQSPRSD